MTNTSIAQATRRLITGCSLALLIAGGSAFAHGGGGGTKIHFSVKGEQFSSGGHGRCIKCGSSNDGAGRNIDGNYWRHHHHHHAGKGPGGLGTVHGPGSSHNPIITHPISKPITVTGPAKRPPEPRQKLRCRDHRGLLGNPNVRDHRSRPPWHYQCFF